MYPYYWQIHTYMFKMGIPILHPSFPQKCKWQPDDFSFSTDISPSTGNWCSESGKSGYCEQLLLWKIYYILAKSPLINPYLLLYRFYKRKLPPKILDLRCSYNRTQAASKQLWNISGLFKSSEDFLPWRSSEVSQDWGPLWDGSAHEDGQSRVVCGRWSNASVLWGLGCNKCLRAVVLGSQHEPIKQVCFHALCKHWKTQKQKENNLTTICVPVFLNLTGIDILYLLHPLLLII